MYLEVAAYIANILVLPVTIYALFYAIKAYKQTRCLENKFIVTAPYKTVSLYEKLDEPFCFKFKIYNYSNKSKIVNKLIIYYSGNNKDFQHTVFPNVLFIGNDYHEFEIKCYKDCINIAFSFESENDIPRLDNNDLQNIVIKIEIDGSIIDEFSLDKYVVCMETTSTYTKSESEDK